jgi:deazaflavin-dependent oxidoreductase (nitroreductase family)
MTISEQPATSSPTRMFPAPDTSLARVIGDRAHREAFHARLASMNRYVVALYRLGVLPLFGAGQTTMLLVTKGRKSGRRRAFPVGYFRIGGEIHLLSGWGKDANWYKNLVAAPDDVSLQVGFRRFPARARVIQDRAEILATLERLIRESPAAAQRLFGWDPARDQWGTSDFSQVLEKVLFIKFTERANAADG